MRLVGFFLLAYLFVGCSTGRTVPGDIIPIEKMETIIWQIAQSDEYANTLLNRDPTKKASTEKMKVYQQVCALNDVTISDFKKSYQFYLDHPDITKLMFDSISARSSRLRAQMYQSKPDSQAGIHPLPAPLRADSLRVTLPLLRMRNDSIVRKIRLDSLKRDSVKKARLTRLQMLGPKKRSKLPTLPHH